MRDRDIAERALQAALDAGAGYADVRVQEIETEELAVRNGVLEITVPLSQSSQQRRTVQIQNASDDTAKSQGANGGRASATSSSGS